MLRAISPIDGRYKDKVKKLEEYFSEYALIKYRIFVEIQYFVALYQLPLPQLQKFDPDHISELVRIYNQFDDAEALKIKQIEKITNHDVKAVEYYLKEHFQRLGLEKYSEFIHFGLTSQDINNTAYPLLFLHALDQQYYPMLQRVIEKLDHLSSSWKTIPMLARTHGQPASPTTLGKEFEVFSVRLKNQLNQLRAIPHQAKFGGATGNLNAHYVAYPLVDWHAFAGHFVEQYLGLCRSFPTTQIEHYDNLAAQLEAMKRINVILLDFSRDVWTYISMDYFRQKTQTDEIGSSAMPHKVNPIDFENAEGNLGLANAIFTHMADKLPISRLQRDLTDSTVLRNLGVPFAHTLIAMDSILKGLSKLLLNEVKISADLESQWVVVSEAIQTILRREGYEQPYEALKSLTRGVDNISRDTIHTFIDRLEVSNGVKKEMKAITPHNYIGKV